MATASVKSGTGVTRFDAISPVDNPNANDDGLAVLGSSTLTSASKSGATTGRGIQYREGSETFFTNTTSLRVGMRFNLASAGAGEDCSDGDTLVFIHHSSQNANARLPAMTSSAGAGLFLNSSNAGNEEAVFVCAGLGDLFNEFIVYVVDPSRSTDADVYDDGTGGRGTFDPTDVTDIGVFYQHTAAGPVQKCSSAGKLTPVVLIGGDGADPDATFTTISDHFDDNVTLLHTEPVPDTHVCFFRFDFGDGGTNAVVVDISDQTFIFGGKINHSTPRYGAHVDDNTFGHTCNLGASDSVTVASCSFSSSTPFKFRIEGNSGATVSYSSCSVINAGDFAIDDGYTFSGCTFDSCGELACSQPTLTSCTFANADAVALVSDTDEPLANCTTLTFTNNPTAIEVDITGDPSTCDIDITGHSFSGNTTDILYSGTGTLTITGTAAQEAALTTSAPSGTIVWNTPTITLTVNSDQSGSDIKIFETGTQTIEASATGTQATTTTLGTYDITVQKAGFLPQRRTGVALGASSVTLDFELVADPVYDSGHGLTFTTDYSYNPTTRVITIVAAQQGRSVYSALIDDFISETSLRNYPFPISAVGIDRFDFLSDGTTAATIDSGDIQFWRGAGFTIEHATTGNHTARYCYINGTGTNASGTKGYYQQVDGASPTALTLVSNNVQSAIQYYTDTNGDGTPDSNYEDHLVIKLFNDGYYQKGVNVLTAYDISALEPQEYIVDLGMTETGLGTGDRSITVTVTDNSTTPVEEQTGYFFDYKIEGGASDSPEDLLRQWIFDIYTDPTASDYASKVNFNWPDPIVESGGSYSTQRGFVYGQDTTTTFSGFYVEEGSDYHPDFLRQQANDGSFFVTPVIAQISVSGMSDDSTAGDTRLQLWNETGRTASAWQATTAYTDGEKALRSTGIGTESTAGLYFVVTTAGTTGGTEPTWNTTPGATTTDGTVTWTCYAVLFYDNDPAGSTYNDTYNNSEEFITGDTLGYRFADLNGSSTFKLDSGTVVVSASGATVVVSPTADSIYAVNSVDGSAVTQFTADFNNDEIDLSADADFTAAQAYGFYCYTLTTSNGMWGFWAGVVATSGNYEIQTATLNLKFDNTTTGSVKQTDSARIYRDDGVYPVKDPSTSGYGVQVNWANQVFAINTGGSGLTAGESALLADIAPIKAKTDSLTFTNAGEVDSNMKSTNDYEIVGDGSSADKFRSVNA